MATALTLRFSTEGSVERHNFNIWGNFGHLVTPENFENKILSYELEVMTKTCLNIFGEVFGPCAHCWPCEALEQQQKIFNVSQTEYYIISKYCW